MAEANAENGGLKRIVRLLGESLNYLSDTGNALKDDPTIETLSRVAQSFIIEALDEIDPEFEGQEARPNYAVGLIDDAIALADAMRRLIDEASPARGTCGLAALFLLDARQSLDKEIVGGQS